MTHKEQHWQHTNPVSPFAHPLHSVVVVVSVHDASDIARGYKEEEEEEEEGNWEKEGEEEEKNWEKEGEDK